MKFAPALIAIAALSASALSLAQPADPDDCAQKRAGLTSEMEKAKSAGKDAHAVSLERARGELAVSCSEPGERVMSERRISTQEKKVTQAQKAVDAAEKDGKGDGAKARAELKKAQAELERLKRDAAKKEQKQKPKPAQPKPENGGQPPAPAKP